MNELVSIILPVYKVEKYLEKCIETLIRQTYKNIEIILIDDGSPDKCGVICDEYSKKDERVKVVHNLNKGVSNARNTGLKMAKGRYICFVDPDDYVAEDYIEYLYKILLENNADISCCNFEYVYENAQENIETLKEKENIKIYNTIDGLEDLLYQKNIDTSSWGKLFKREAFSNILFPEGKIYEDFGTIYKVIMKLNVIVYSNQKKYYYLQRKESTIGRAFKEKDFDMLELSKEMERYILDEYPQLDKAVKSRILNMDFYFLRRMDKKEYKKQYNDIKCNIKQIRKDVYSSPKIKMKTKIAIIISYINIDLVKYIYYISTKIKFFGLNKYVTKYKK